MNKAFITGRLTKDPELRYTSTNNTANCSFTLAVDKYVKGQDKQADFINCVAWTNTAEFVAKYFAKGSKMILEGRISTRNWEDAEGKKHYITEVVAEKVEFADGKKIDAPKNDTQDGFYALNDDDELPF